MHDSFSLPTELKGKLMDAFKGKLLSAYDFQIGYFTPKKEIVSDGSSRRLISFQCISHLTIVIQ